MTPRWRTSLTLTLVLRMAAVTVLLGAVMVWLVYLAVDRVGDALVMQTIDTDIEALADQYNAQGLAALKARIGDRQAVVPLEREQPFYLLLAPSGQVEAGNLVGRVEPAALAAIDPARSGAGEIPIRGEPYPVLLRATRLRGGYSLYAGLTTRGSREALAGLRVQFLAALLFLAIGAVTLGLLASARVRQRLARLAARMAVLAGTPAPSQAGLQGDEIDALDQVLATIGQRIAQLLAAQRDVTDNIAHETRTPLMVIDARLQDILEHTRDPVVIEHAEQASREIKSMLHLLDALLDIAAAEAGRGEQSGLSEVSLTEICLSIAELYRSSVSEAGLVLATRIAPDVRLAGEAMQLSRLLVNLLENALKHATGATFVGLSLDPGPVLVVEDDGEGIAPADRERVFQRYGRGRSRQARGHGLGLPLVKAIAKRHGLTIRVSAREPGAGRPGTRFIISRSDMPEPAPMEIAS